MVIPAVAPTSTRSRSLRRLAVAGLGAGLLSSCGTHPGDAATVGSTSISESRVDSVAAALCTAQSRSQQSSTTRTGLSSRAARAGALDVLIQSELSRQFAASRGSLPSQAETSRAVDGQQQTLDQLPADRRAAFRSVLQAYAEGQLGLTKVGQQELSRTGSTAASSDAALAAGQKARDAWVARHVQVSVDPRFGEFRGVRLVTSSGSLSVPQSATAVDGAHTSPAQSWVASLPANQQCG